MNKEINLKLADIKDPLPDLPDHFKDYLKESNIIANQGDGISIHGLDNTFIRFACGTDEQMDVAMAAIS